MKKINRSRFAILGMLLEKPRSGYEIRKFMHFSTDHFWQESDASIYPMLNILEKEGKLTSKSEAVGKRERKIFEITQSGKDEFFAWMASPSKKEIHRNDLLLKLFLGANVPKEEILKLLVSHKQKALAEKKEYIKIENDALSQFSDEYPHKLFWIMTLRYGMQNVSAKLEWIEDCIKLLKNK